MQEITDKGIVIDANNFRAVEFEVGFVLDGQTISVKLPGGLAGLPTIYRADSQ
jgi:hypothetical protein